MINFKYTRTRRNQKPNTHFLHADDPLAHPAIATMSERELGDLPLTEILQAAYHRASADHFDETIRADNSGKP